VERGQELGSLTKTTENKSGPEEDSQVGDKEQNRNSTAGDRDQFARIEATVLNHDQDRGNEPAHEKTKPGHQARRGKRRAAAQARMATRSSGFSHEERMSNRSLKAK
jgi:hypothetical protein